jgi:hypothetical protein
MRGACLVAVLPLALICAAGAAWGGLNVPPPADSMDPQWLPDGHHLVLRGSYLPIPSSDPQALYVAADDGSGFGPAAGAEIPARPDVARSPDGARVAFVTDGEVWTSALDGGAPQQVTQGADASADTQPPAWSPDGGKIAFYCCGDRIATIEVIDVDGANLHRVHRGGSVAWVSPTELAVGLDGYATTIYRVGVDGRNARPIVTGYNGGRFDVSPDGTQIAFASPMGWAYDSGLAVYVADTSGLDERVRLVSPTVCSVESTLFSEPHGRCISGTNGDDVLVGSRIGDLIVAGPGDDVIRAGGGQNIVQAQWGDDTISAGPKIDFIDAGAGNDLIRSGGGNDRVNPGPGRDVVHAGAGNDIVVANDGERDIIDCGRGEDRVLADRVDVLTSCEHVTYAPPDPDQK